MTTIHTPNYLDILQQASSAEQMLDMDTYTTKESWDLANNAAGGAAAVALSVWEKESQYGFALTRPPGHHACPSRGMGFCLLNNVALAAEYLIQEKSSTSVAILDIDLHHGNGTQDIFWERNDVSYLSIHQAPFYPGTGSLTEIGINDGEKSTLNLPIPSGSGDLAYQTLISEIVLPFLEMQEPQILLISFGFDTHWKDPLGSMLLSANGIYEIHKTLCQWAADHCENRLAVFLEGGYDLDAGKACGQGVAAALLDLPFQDPLGQAPIQENSAWRKTLDEAKQIWNM
jgi:acetoin utilization deacetylase AcuC-like enzyme